MMETLTTVLILFGLFLNMVGAIALIGFQWRPLRLLGMSIKREYERLNEGLVTLRDDLKLTPEDEGYDEVKRLIIGGVWHFSGMDIDTFEPVDIDVSEDNEVTLQFEDPRDYQMNIEPYIRIDYDLLREKANTYARNGFIKFGVIFLILGFGLQMLSQILQMAY